MYIGIVTSAKELNYGAILQAYALQRVINDSGYKAELLWWSNQKTKHHDIRLRKLMGMFVKYMKHPSLFLKTYKIYNEEFNKEFDKSAIDRFHNFEKEYLNIRYLSYAEMKKYANNDECKAVIAGSDQIWNSYAVYVDPFYYLRFAPRFKRIAYAPSLGKSQIPKYNKRIMKKYIEEFQCVSVRENSGKKLVDSLIDKEVKVVLDPSFLLSKKDWLTISQEIECLDKYVLLYFLDEPNDACLTTIIGMLNKFKCRAIAFPYRFTSLLKIENIEFVDPGPSEFISLIAGAEFVMTDSFHGTAFSINLNKQFYTFDRQYGNNQSQSSRILDILELFNLKSRFLADNEIVDEGVFIDYRGVNEILELQRNHSKDFLFNSIRNVENDC